MVLVDLFSGKEELAEQAQAEPIGTEQVQLGPVQIRQSLTETPVLERKMITDASGIVEAVGLPVSYLAADGTRKPYRYELREIMAQVVMCALIKSISGIFQEKQGEFLPKWRDGTGGTDCSK